MNTMCLSFAVYNKSKPKYMEVLLFSGMLQPWNAEHVDIRILTSSYFMFFFLRLLPYRSRKLQRECLLFFLWHFTRYSMKHLIDAQIMNAVRRWCAAAACEGQTRPPTGVSSGSGAVWLSLTLTDSCLEILRGIGSLITHNHNYRRTRQTHKALKQDERLPPLLPLAHISQIPLKLKEDRGSGGTSLDRERERDACCGALGEEMWHIN